MKGHSDLETLALRQLGLVARRQLLALGYSRRQIELLVESGLLVQVRRGIYRLYGSTPGWRMSAMAAVLAAGPGALLSHRSAGVLWDLLVQHNEIGPLEITTPKFCNLEGVLTHRGVITAKEKTRRFGIPVTTAERTLLDLANTVAAEELGRLCDEALRRRILTMSNLRAVVDAHQAPGRRKLKPILAVLGDRIPGYDPGANDWELRMDRMWDQMGLPAAERQYRIRIGRSTYRLDRAIVDLKIAVEWNGFDPHGRRGNMDRDSDRRAALGGGRLVSPRLHLALSPGGHLPDRSRRRRRAPTADATWRRRLAAADPGAKGFSRPVLRRGSSDPPCPPRQIPRRPGR